MEKTHTYHCTENENTLKLIEQDGILDEIQVAIADRKTGKAIKGTGGWSVIGAYDLSQALESVGLKIVSAAAWEALIAEDKRKPVLEKCDPLMVELVLFCAKEFHFLGHPPVKISEVDKEQTIKDLSEGIRSEQG
jgi:hypothetical protein